MNAWLGVVCSLILSASALAQPATIAVFTTSTTDPNVTMPVAPPATYATPTCDQQKISEVLPIENPTVGHYDDPANQSRDCVVQLEAQLAAIPAGGYRGAVKLGDGLYGPLSTAFSLTEVQPPPAAHPCDSTPLSPTTVAIGQPFTIGWCHPWRDTNGQPTIIHGWQVYRNNVLLVGHPVSRGTTSAKGLTYYSVQRLENAVGVVTMRATALNAGGESARSSVLTVTVTATGRTPSTPTRGRVTIP